jgi:hypothetical protein
MKACGVLIAAVLVAAIPGSATAKPGYFVFGPGRGADFSLRGSNNYKIEVQARPAARRTHQQVYVIARNGPSSVTYAVFGSLGADDSIDAHLPHVGRIAVRFHPVHLTRGRRADNCKGRPSFVEHGYFRGRIELRGERGFTLVDRASAPGRVTRHFRQVCDNEEGGGHEHANRGFDLTALVAGRKKGGRVLQFVASRAEIGSSPGNPSFAADSVRRREGMTVISSVSLSGEPDQFVAPRPDATKVAEVMPPRPFQGAATFTLTSPTTASWEGDLGVELPGVGPVSLAGPDFWSALCELSGCTKTAPPGTGFSFAFLG